MSTKGSRYLFEMLSHKTAPRRLVLMHVVDAGSGCNDKPIAMFECRRCGLRTEWIEIGMTQAKRGLACPTCN